MTKKVDTDPNFPPTSGSATEPDLDSMLEELAKPKPLDHKETRASSAGTDAAEYHAEPRAPPQREDHNTFPNAPVIVHHTEPSISPTAGELQVTAEERKRLEEEFEYRRRARDRAKQADSVQAALERAAETGPQRTDPPGVTSDPSRRANAVSKSLVALLLIVVVSVIIGVAMRTKTTTSTVTSTTATDVPSTRTSAPVESAKTTTTSTTSDPTAATSQTVYIAPTSTTTTRPTVTHTGVVTPPTALTTTTTTATVSTGAVAPPDIRGSN